MAVVSVCTDWASAMKILKADPGEGPWRAFCVTEMEKRFCAGHDYLGAAANLFFFDLKQWTVEGVEVPLIEAQSYALKKFQIEKALRYFAFLDIPGGVAPKSDTPAPKFEWQLPVVAAATGATVATATTGQHGKWRKIASDVQVYAFLYALASAIRKTPWTNASRKVLSLLEAMALHVPVDVYPFAITPALPKELFLKSFQLMENFSVKMEGHGSTGWKMCCYFHQARKMVDHTRDVNDLLAAHSSSLLTTDSALGFESISVGACALLC